MRRGRKFIYVVMTILLFWGMIGAAKVIYEVGNVKYYSLRLREDSLGRLVDDFYDVTIEEVPFEIYSDFPNVYIYGLGGITKMNVIPFWGTIKKVPNISFEKWIQERNKKYYGSNSILYKGYTGREATLKDLRTVYGDSLIEGKDVSVYTDEDILFLKE